MSSTPEKIAAEIVRRELEAYYVSPRPAVEPFDLREAIAAAIREARASALPPDGHVEPDMFWPDDCDEGEGAHSDLELIADRCEDGQVFVVQQAKRLPYGYYVTETTPNGETGYRNATDEEIAAHKKGVEERLARWREEAKKLPAAHSARAGREGE
jgi:hypothetical protein